MTGRTLNFVIPSISRLHSLEQTVRSIKKQAYKNYHITIVVDDGRKDYLRQVHNTFKHQQKLTILFNPKRLGWPRSMNRVFKETDFDYYFYGSDDLGFGKETILEAMTCIDCKFPDGDGVVGMIQNLKHFCPGAFGIFGRKWKERFPDAQVFFPGYMHFCGDSELWHYSKSINKFYFCKRAMVQHRRFQDPCHKLAQKTLRKDREIWWQKKGRPGKYWGASFKIKPPF